MSRKAKRRPRRDDPLDEPGQLPDDEWVEWGDELISAVDFTSGGAPIGMTRREMEEAEEREARDAPWARAKAALRRALQRAAPSAQVEVGRCTRLGGGLSRHAFVADVDVFPDRHSLTDTYVVLLPARGAGPDVEGRTLREARLLQRLGSMSLPFRVPRVLDVVRDGRDTLVVRTLVAGVPLDLRAGRQPSVRPWDVVAELAAAIHRIPTADVGALDGSATRRAHVEGWVASLADVRAPETTAALDWVRAHLPPDEPSVLVHGDLLGQNILLAPGDPRPLGVIDWEYARLGDPAYDLAIVTRGTRRPFQIDRGLERLIDAYRTQGGVPVTATDVHVHEVCMNVRWCHDSLQPGATEPSAEAFGRLRRLMGRVGA
jgi:aminoglycoside phosphotransferase (APT) family kinase protein